MSLLKCKVFAKKVSKRVDKSVHRWISFLSVNGKDGFLIVIGVCSIVFVAIIAIIMAISGIVNMNSGNQSQSHMVSQGQNSASKKQSIEDVKVSVDTDCGIAFYSIGYKEWDGYKIKFTRDFFSAIVLTPFDILT